MFVLRVKVRLASEGADECERRLRAAAAAAVLILRAKNTAWQLLCLREFSERGGEVRDVNVEEDSEVIRCVATQLFA